MKYSTFILIGMVFLLSIVALMSHASAECVSCEKEGDWGQSANAFINGQPMSDDPIPFGPKVERQTTSQFEKQDKATDTAGQGSASVAAELLLKSLNVTPAQANQASTVKITATFALNGSTEEQKELQLTAAATIKDSTGKDIVKLNLIRTSENEYSKDWTVNVPPGIYSVDIAASSLEAAGTFADAAQIEVVASGNAS
ncbi:MAG: hypothetical protein PHQ34_09755 [Methanothrix sp.]|nr:hypothetical protein [Methanothrix sp.]